MGDGNIIHYGGVRVRVATGSGSLVPTILDLNSTAFFTPIPIPLTTLPSEPFRTLNMVTQRAKLRLELDNKDEYMTVTKIIVYFKPLWTSLPG